MSTLKRVSTTVLIALIISIVTTVTALAATTYIDEFGSRFSGSNLIKAYCSGCQGQWAYWRSSLDGRGSGTWKASHNNTITWWYVYIPNQYDAVGGVWYEVQNSVQSFQVPVIQSHHRGQWVRLGFLDVGNNAKTHMRNTCSGLTYCYLASVYWDAAKYVH